MKRKMKVLLSVFGAAFLLAACNNAKPTDTDITPTSVTEPSVTQTPDATSTPAPELTTTPLSTPTPLPTPTPRPDITDVSLKEIYKDYFMLGTIYNPGIESGLDGELVTKHFNIITPENLMKPEYMQPKEGTFNFASSDRMMLVADVYDFKVVGHTLAWHNQSGPWLGVKNAQGQPVTREEAIEQLKNHIYGVAGKYKGQIHSWDVLNEAINDGVKLPLDGDWTKCLRKTQWLDSIGPDYVAMAFQFAHEADPDALLYYNDYNLNIHDKAEIVAAMVTDLRSQGVPVHGIGMQGHYSTDTNISSVRSSLKMFSQIEGIVVSVTELDVGVPGSNHSLSSKNEKKQALFYAKLFSLYKEYSDIIERVTFWGYRDDTSWRSENCPMIFDKNLEAKEAFYALMDPEAYIAAADQDPTPEPRMAEAYPGTPVIDGQKDPIWLKDARAYVIDTPLFAWQGAKGTVRLLWDECYVYALFEVEDSVLNASSPNSYEQDSIEIFLDEENKKEDYYTDAAGQYRVNYKGELSFGTVPSERGVEAAASLTDKGYIVEIAIPLVGNASQGMVFGFDAQINDSNAQGSRQSVMKFNDPTDNSYASTTFWGELILK